MASGELLSRRSFLARRKRRGRRACALLAVPFEPVRTRRRNPRSHRLAGHPSGQLDRRPRRACRDGAGRTDRPCHAGRRRTRMRLVESPDRIRPSRQENVRRKNVSGATCRPALAARSRPRSFICGRPAPPRGKCWSRLPRRAGKCRHRNASRPVSVITHGQSGRSVTFGAVAEDAAKVPPPAEVELKNPDQWKLVGTPRRRLDVLDKVTAQAGLCDRRAAAGDAVCGNRALPGVRRRAEDNR